MLVDGKPRRTLWLKKDNPAILQIIDQRWLPHRFVVEDLKSVADVARAIKEMHVRGAPLIGATAAYGMVFACREADPAQDLDRQIETYGDLLKATRPTAVNLAWGVERVYREVLECEGRDAKISRALKVAKSIEEEEVESSRKIGEHGVKIIERLREEKGGQCVNILTHCNAGWLACVDYGTATAPMYEARRRGIDIHVWVDETRPRNQGASLTAWELGQNDIPHTVIADNTGGHLMQHGMVDMVIVGTDRTTRCGDVANKIGTYLKALAANDNGVPFYVALTSSAFDWKTRDGVKEIPIEERDEDEVRKIQGWCDGELKSVLLTPYTSKAVNYGFDVTPSRLVTGLISERGICKADETSILGMYPEQRD